MKCLLVLLCFASLMSAQTDPIWNFPALAYGPHRWSVLKVTNPKRKSITVHATAYDQSGMPLPVPDTFDLNPGEAREIRIEKSVSKDEFAWVRIEPVKGHRGDLAIEAWTELLRGDTIARAPQHDVQLALFDSWYAAPGNNRFFYIANIGVRDLKLTICWTNNPRRDVCSYKEEAKHASQVSIWPKGALLARLGKPTGRFLVVIQQWDPKGNLPMLATFLGPGKEEKRQFSTDSALDFEGVDANDVQ